MKEVVHWCAFSEENSILSLHVVTDLKNPLVVLKSFKSPYAFS